MDAKSRTGDHPLINLMQDEIINYRVAFADETTVQVLNEPNRRAQTKSFMWCFIGGPPDRRSIIYQYHPTREGDVAGRFFEGFHGALHCDGYGGYNALLKSQHIIGINCFAHVRRKFVEALPNGKEKGVAGYIVNLIRLLYKIEANLKTKKADWETIKEIRQQQAKPILDQLKTFLDEKVNTTLPSSKVGQAIEYTLKRWPYLTTYLIDGEYEIGRVENWRVPYYVSSPRSSNRTCATNASGFRTKYHTFALGTSAIT
jgi:transposase